ncbi:rhodanese-like domain-containing protein [Sansalvadorimonas verongulae]|uniref:rhodanese-like domain-containing protein n=1 Tax=Sansalvadorimonas verongulae TaxID=2172824 RepID=UPI001E4C545A|nr:rhodanese-like domain-containing protein [Sansalvadorimonas verongulae]
MKGCLRGVLGAAVLSLAGVMPAKEAPVFVTGAETISTEQARELFQSQAAFIDVRSREKWQWGHIEGAQHFGLYSTFALLKHPGFISKDQPLVIYGNGSHTMRSALAAHLAASWGYKTVYYYRDGYFSWQAKDLPIAQSEGRSALEASILQSFSE